MATQRFLCSPRSLGFHDPIWLINIFQMGWSNQPNKCLNMYLDPPRSAKVYTVIAKGAIRKPLRVQTSPVGGCLYIHKMSIRNEYTFRYTGIRLYSRKNTFELDLFVNFGWNCHQVSVLQMAQFPVYLHCFFYVHSPLTPRSFGTSLDPCRSLNTFEAIEFRPNKVHNYSRVIPGTPNNGTPLW